MVAQFVVPKLNSTFIVSNSQALITHYYYLCKRSVVRIFHLALKILC